MNMGLGSGPMGVESVDEAWGLLESGVGVIGRFGTREVDRLLRTGKQGTKKVLEPASRKIPRA